MAIQFHPKAGTILVCDFRDGFRPPEMVKRRPAVVISPPISARPGLCTVVPISTEPPGRVMAYHVELRELALPPPFEAGPNWVKADMIYALSFERLDLFRAGRRPDGKRSYNHVQLSAADFLAVQRAVLASLTRKPESTR